MSIFAQMAEKSKLDLTIMGKLLGFSKETEAKYLLSISGIDDIDVVDEQRMKQMDDLFMQEQKNNVEMPMKQLEMQQQQVKDQANFQKMQLRQQEQQQKTLKEEKEPSKKKLKT